MVILFLRALASIRWQMGLILRQLFTSELLLCEQKIFLDGIQYLLQCLTVDLIALYDSHAFFEHSKTLVDNLSEQG